MAGHVIHQVREGVSHIVLNRPDRMNALDDDTMADLLDAVVEANTDARSRAIVVSAAGPHFSAGGDLDWEAAFDVDRAAITTRRASHLTHELRNSPKPTIGAIRGYCIGGGNALNMQLDACIASRTALFGHPETRWGILPFWNTPQLLPLLVGERRAREMILFGRLYDAVEAAEMGLCNVVVDDEHLEGEALAWAAELADRSATAVRLTKIALNSPFESLAPATNHQSAIAGLAMSTERYKEEVRSFFASKASRRPRRAREVRERHAR